MKKPFILVNVICLLLIAGCHKTDIHSKLPSNSVRQKFFDGAMSPSHDMAAVIKAMKAIDSSKPFIEELSKNAGFPVWGKVLKEKVVPKATPGRRNLGFDSLLIIPLVLENTNRVNAYMEVRGQDSLQFKVVYGSSYAKRQFGSSNTRKLTAEKLSMQLMYLDYHVFGHTIFRVSDLRVFGTPPAGKDSSRRFVLFKGADTTQASNTAARLAYRTISVCTWNINFHCPGYWPCTATRCDNCPEYCVSAYYGCTTTGEWYEEDDDPTVGGGGGGGGGSGGGSYTNWPSTSPCYPDPANPSTYICQPGYTPAPPPIPLVYLSLNVNQDEWLEANPVLSAQITNYIALSPLADRDKKAILLEHINRMMTDPEYLSFVNHHLATGNATIPWWIDDPFIAANFERRDSDPEAAQDITKIFKCFDAVPDAGATYSIKLCADVPVNSHPNAPMNLVLSPGHVFLQITKQNGAASVTKSFGFYPVSGPLSVLGDPVNSKIVNDANHEINASIEMSITAAQFNTVKTKALQTGTAQYDIDDFSCGGFAVGVFNSIRPGDEINPDAMLAFVPDITLLPKILTCRNSPQKLFKKLKEMKQAGGPEAGNIVISTNSSYTSANTTGGCD